VTVPILDVLFRAYERFAQRMRLHRSVLYSRASTAFLARRGRKITKRLNAIYATPANEPDPVILANNREMLRQVEWEE
jgi:hypothetical protein